jgi:molybdopterin-binding protein
MSQIIAHITHIQQEKNLHLVTFDFNTTPLTMMSLELNDTIKVGAKVVLNVKPTHITLVKSFTGEISHSNQIQAKVKHIEEGKLLCAIQLYVHDIVLESITTQASCTRMNLQKDDEVTILIKASELSIAKVLS